MLTTLQYSTDTTDWKTVITVSEKFPLSKERCHSSRLLVFKIILIAQGYIVTLKLNTSSNEIYCQLQLF